MDGSRPPRRSHQGQVTHRWLRVLSVVISRRQTVSGTSGNLKTVEPSPLSGLFAAVPLQGLPSIGIAAKDLGAFVTLALWGPVGGVFTFLPPASTQTST